jgi:hypothetical protein
MDSRLQFGTVRALLIFIGFLLFLGISVGLDKGSTLSMLSAFLVIAFLLVGSVGILIRMWRTRGSSDQFWKSAHGGQIGFSPAKVASLGSR